MRKCPRYEMNCPSDPCVFVCETMTPRPALRYPNLELTPLRTHGPQYDHADPRWMTCPAAKPRYSNLEVPTKLDLLIEYQTVDTRPYISQYDREVLAREDRQSKREQTIDAVLRVITLGDTVNRLSVKIKAAIEALPQGTFADERDER